MVPIQPPIQWVLGPFSAGVKQPGWAAQHSPASNDKVKEWNSTSILLYVVMVWYLDKHRYKFACALASECSVLDVMFYQYMKL
jgi:hypothetical protein